MRSASLALLATLLVACGPAPHAETPDPRCEVIEVEGRAGCWEAAEVACQEVCGDPACLCTEATSNNTCGCGPR